VQAYRTGRGSVYVRAKAEVGGGREDRSRDHHRHEIPYQVNKARLIEKIAELVKEKKIEGITELRDESDKDGMRIVIEIKRGESGEMVLNNPTSTPSCRPRSASTWWRWTTAARVMNLKDLLDAFLLHRREVVTRRTVFELRKARDRATSWKARRWRWPTSTRSSSLIATPTPADAKAALVAKGWELGNVAAMLEKAGDDAARPEWLDPEYGMREGQYLTETGPGHPRPASAPPDRPGAREDPGRVPISAGSHRRAAAHPGSPERLMEVIRDELLAVREQYGDERRTEISMSSAEINIED
jgi:DNA gyrase subunit A